jgi:hypothetical protein
MLQSKHYVGLDLGQVSDYSALVVLRREQEVPEPPRPSAAEWRSTDYAAKSPAPTKPLPARYYCNIAERFERGTPYTKLVDNVGRYPDAVAWPTSWLVTSSGCNRGRCSQVDEFCLSNEQTSAISSARRSGAGAAVP